MATQETVMLKMDCMRGKGPQTVNIICARTDEGKYVPLGGSQCREADGDCEECITKAMQFVLHGSYEAKTVKVDRTWGTALFPL